MNELQRLLDEVIRERDELIDRLKSCRVALDDMTEHAEEFKAEVGRMKEERNKYLVELSRIRIDLCQAKRSEEAKIIELDMLKAERDDAIEHADCEKQFADGLKAERDEAREAARFFRDVYVSQVGRTYPEEYRLPWEVEK